MLFAHFGLTGPAILDVSRAVARHDGPDRLDLALDLIPDVAARGAGPAPSRPSSRQGRRSLAALLPESLPRRLAECVVDGRGHPARTGWARTCRATSGSGWSPRSRGCRCRSRGTLGFAKAEVTSGGVALDEVDPRTLESRLVPGLHFAGEVLDLDGLIGGYNFQAAWSTGWLAGETAARSVGS